ncbi:BREX system serine/threonine kinase PglW [Arthrobacter rhombi]|uniref:BREX system serine/threonine kinase PglW n=1 Tax=Arthrobacter rhombi TaxID=71253 RepID=UPI003FD0379B
MKEDSPLWHELGEPASPAERVALETFRKILPDDGITTAWSNLTFIDEQGRTSEIDVLLLTPAGLFLVELKGWHGNIRGNSQRWDLPTRNVANPLLLTDLKAKRLSSLLKSAFPNQQQTQKTLPFIKPLIVLHGAGSRINLDTLGATGVFFLNGYDVKATGTPVHNFSHFLAQPPANQWSAVDLQRARAVRGMCKEAGFRKTPKVRMVADYQVSDSTPIAEGPDWQDVLVDMPAMPEVKRRLRLYDIYPKAPASERVRVEQLALREYQLTYGIKHEGITVPVDFKKTDDGPALLFDYNNAEIPLDAYLASEAGKTLQFEDRIAFVLQLGETLHYAHQRHLIHRALAPQCVWVVPSHSQRPPRPMVRDWYTGQKERTSSAASMTDISAGATDIMGISSSDSWMYLAPEARSTTLDVPGVPLDVYGFGALAYLVLTGKAPAANFPELEELLRTEGALDPRRAGSGMPDSVADVVVKATTRREADRSATLDEVLTSLRSAWDQLRRPDPEADPVEVADPIDAQAGDALGDRFLVLSRRGEGSSGVALGVGDTASTDPDREVVMKVARTDAAASRLLSEAQALTNLDHRRIVRLLEGPTQVGSRTAIVMSDAGTETLATRLLKEGRSTVGQLERFGGQLLDALSYLETKGVFHRDIKPANIGTLTTRQPDLVLFDFSLASEPLDSIAAGTPGYLDPFLGQGRRQRYDRAAELWAAAVTLFEMSTGQLPWWPEGSGRPSSPTEEPVVQRASFETSVSEPLVSFFAKALHPDARNRFASADEMASSWYQVFASLDAGTDDAQANDDLAKQADLDTPLERAGLSARALSGALRLDEVITVGDLLGVSPVLINRIRGLGEVYRKELVARIRQWREHLTQDDPSQQVRGTEQLVGELLKKIRKADDRAVVKAVLEGESDNDWPTPVEVGKLLGQSREQVAGVIQSAAETWSRTKDRSLETVRSEVLSILHRSGRIMTRPELATALVAEQGSLLDGQARLRQGSALLRAVVELDARLPEPAIELRRRRGGRVDLVALHESSDPDQTGAEHPAADMLTELAGELGDTADALVADGRIVPFSQASEALRDVWLRVAGTDLFGIVTERRLLRLASAASMSAEVSAGFDELYPASLDAVSALETALRGKPGRNISVDAVRRSVSARFPNVQLPASQTQLDAIVQKVLPGVQRDEDTYVAQTTRTSTQTASRTHTSFLAASPDAARTLQASFGRRSALTLCTASKHYARTAHELPGIYTGQGLQVLDVAELLVDATRKLAIEFQIKWDFVIDMDAKPHTTPDWVQLSQLVRQAVTPAWHQALAQDVPLLIVNVSALMRYGMSPLLADLLDLGTPRPAARWLLVARDGRNEMPLLDGKPVPVGPSGWLDLPSDLSTFSTDPTSITTGAAQ